MSATPKDYSSHVPVPTLCKGRIRTKITDRECYEVEIYASRRGSFSGPIYATAIFSPGSDGAYREGDFVKVIVYFNFGGVKAEYMDPCTGHENHIIGLFQERSIINVKTQNLISPQDEDRVQFANSKSKSNLSICDSGKIILASDTVNHTLAPMGNGMWKDSSHLIAQNHHRWISFCPPYYLSREHFGMYSGANLDEEGGLSGADDFLINYRRFVTQTRASDKWVSSCEGTWAPWVGVNNDHHIVTKSKETLFSKVINYKKSRLTVEAGAPGDAFLDIRIDDVIRGESKVDSAPGATPATVGGRFHMSVSDKGAATIKVAGDGAATTKYAAEISIGADGAMKIFASGQMLFSHSANDSSVNSIKMDPNAGIDITAVNGFRVNGLELLTTKVLEWLDNNKAALCQVTAVGVPAPLTPTALAAFMLGKQSLQSAGGFTTKDVGAPASGPTPEADQHTTV